MRKPSSKVGKVAALLASPVAVIVAGALIWQSSYAAFSSTTRNSGNNWATGTVALTDDDAGSARFQAADMVPGQTETKCIKVTATTSVPGTVRGYLVNPVTSPQGLENRIMITVRSGSGGSFGSCTGFVADGASVLTVPLGTFFNVNSFEAAAAAATGDPWVVQGDVPGGESKTYEFTWSFDTTGMTQAEQDALQNARTGADVQWELRNT